MIVASFSRTFHLASGSFLCEPALFAASGWLGLSAMLGLGDGGDEQLAQLVEAFGLVARLRAVLFADEDEDSVVGEATSCGAGEAVLGSVGDGEVGECDAKLGLGRELVDVLPAGASAAGEGKGEEVRWRLHARCEVDEARLSRLEGLLGFGI